MIRLNTIIFKKALNMQEKKNIVLVTDQTDHLLKKKNKNIYCAHFSKVQFVHNTDKTN